MFHDRASTNKVNKIHERASKIIHKDSTSNFQELLSKSNSVSVHQRNLQLLLIEIYKTVHNLNPAFMTKVFEEKDVPYNFRENNSLALPKAKTTFLWHRHHQMYWKRIMADTANRNQRVPITRGFQTKN